MTFSAYDHEGAGHKIQIYEDYALIKIRGSQSYRSGEYTNERNATIEVRVPHEKILEAAEEIKND